MSRFSYCLFGFLISLFFYTQSYAQKQTSIKPVVTVTKVQSQAIANNETFTGRVEAIDKVDLIARVPGFVEAINFKEGAPVTAKDVLFQIEPDGYEATITQIKGQLESTKAAKKLADIEVTRQQTLYDKGTVAQSVLQQAQAEQGKVDGQMQELQGKLQAAELDLSYAKITAPFDGRIGLVDVSIGAFVGPGNGALATITSIDPIYVKFPISETRVLNFRAARAVNPDDPPLEIKIVLANGSDYSETGKVTVIDTEVQPGTDSIFVKASLANHNAMLVDGQFVKVEVVENTQKKSLTVPVQALQKDQAGYFVMVVGDDNKVKKTPVKVGRISGLVAVIDDGLVEGQQVITEGSQRVHDGVEVDAQPTQDTNSPASATTASGGGD